MPTPTPVAAALKPRTQTPLCERARLSADCRQVLAALDRADVHGSDIVLDLRHMAFLDRAAALLVVRLDLCARAAGGRLILVQGAASLHQCLDPIGLIGQLEIVSDPPHRASPAQAGPPPGPSTHDDARLSSARRGVVKRGRGQ